MLVVLVVSGKFAHNPSTQQDLSVNEKKGLLVYFSDQSLFIEMEF